MHPIHNASEKMPIYKKLKQYHCEIVDKSPTWNWDSLTCLTVPGIQRLLHLDFIYKLAIDNPGDIFEFGCHYGASTSILNNLKQIYEPNSNRRIHTFDSFNGLSDPNEKFDDSNTEYKNMKGDYKVNIKNYPEILEDILINQAALYSSVTSKKSFSINKGYINKTLPEFLSKNSSIMLSLVIFDMDLYEPTLEALEIIKPHLINGSFVVFDEIISNEQYPGESLALRNCSYSRELIPFRKSKYVPGAAIFRYKNV